MPTELITLYLKLPVFLLAVSRIGGMLMFQPLLGGQAIPVRVRILFSVGLAALVTPFIDLHAAAPDRPMGILLAMGNEMLLGMALGLTVRACFLGVQLGGQLIAQEAGLAFGQIADPTTNLQQSIVSSLYLQLAGVVFLILGGHRIVLAAILDTFESVPLLGELGVLSHGVDMLFDALMIGAELALRVAAPVVLTMFLVNVAMGFISKTVPQLNIITVGFSVKGMVAFVLIAVSLPPALEAFTDSLELTIGWMTRFLLGQYG